MNLQIFLCLAALALPANVDSNRIATGGTHAPTTAVTHPAEDRVQPNDNRTPSGALRDGVLTLSLEAREAMWYPDGNDSPGTSMPAFAETGKAARIPGPLVRVPVGTESAVTVHNKLADTMLVYGLHSRSSATTGPEAPMILAPGESRTARFRLDATGTFYYWGTTTRRGINFRTSRDAQLTGAIVVDEPNAGKPRDRVFVVGMWTDTVHRAMTHRQRVLAVVNGLSWPHTERLQQTVGDTVRWRLINASADLHPMHLHGFYFRIDSRGDGVRDTSYSANAAQMAVTEVMPFGSTRSVSWIPERAGNWLFHCHIPEHFGARGPLGVKLASDASVSHADHATGGMNGMVMGIEVRPSRVAASMRKANAPPTIPERNLRLLVRPNVGSSGDVPLYGYAIHESGNEPPADSGLGYGQTLDLVRGQPVRITVVNRLPEVTAVHWHGIELESFYDGVPGFSGANKQVTPMIAAGDSFQVRFTPPRSGTFIYHTHAIEERQQLAGLAGVIVVNEPGVTRNKETDIPILISAPTDFAEQGKKALVNGSSTPRAQVMQLGKTYRLRLVQMSTSRAILRVEILRDSKHFSWRLVAKDGADAPNALRVVQPSRTSLGIGETYDFEVTPTAVGAMRLEVRVGPSWPAPSVLLTTMPITVVPER